MPMNWGRPWSCVAPDFRQKLLERLREWLDDPQAEPDLSLTRVEVETAAAAIEESLRNIPMLERRLEKLVHEDARAFRAIKDLKGTEGLYEAARIKGWISAKGKKTTKYPPCEDLVIESQYVALTTKYGQVTIADEVSDKYRDEERFLTFDECPLEPMEAVEVLAKVYGAASREAMLRELWRRHKEIERRRQALSDAGDLEAASSLPDLSTLPQSREVE